MNALFRFFDQNCSLDTRSLALFRIGLGGTIIYNLWTFWPDIDAFFGPHGVNPLYFFYQGSALRWSFFSLSESRGFVVILFIIQGAFALMLAAGFCTRLSLLGSWLMQISLHNRTIITGFGGDLALIAFLMWSLFLPLGERYSVDHMMGRSKQVPDRIVSVAAFCFICQLAIIYICSGFGKNGMPWLSDYTALYLIFLHYPIAKPLGLWLTHFPAFLKALTYTTIFMERHVIFLLFFPFRPAFWRGLLVLMFVAFHLGIDFTMDVGWFSLIMIVIWSALIPSAWWERLGQKGQENTFKDTRIVPSMLAVLLFILVVIYQYNMFKDEVFVNRRLPWINYALQETGIINQRWFMFFRVSYVNQRFIFYPLFVRPPRDLKEYRRIMNWYSNVAVKKYRWFKYFEISHPKREPLVGAYLTSYWNAVYPQGPKIKTIRMQRFYVIGNRMVPAVIYQRPIRLTKENRFNDYAQAPQYCSLGGVVAAHGTADRPQKQL